jgi:hypothetical protein
VFPFIVFPALRTIIYATLVYTAALTVSLVLATALQCDPISAVWRFYEYIPSALQEHCINMNALAWVHVVTNLGLDLWLLILPIPEILRLTFPLKKKLKIIIMFTTGSL